jgi:gliding-associated putative ABC transporter substrate-binding component GldG
MKNILNRKNLFSGHSIAILLIILAILIIINLISVNHFARLDLTEENRYSLSSATKNTLEQLEDPLFVKVYFSQKLPPDLARVEQYVKDILAEYGSFTTNLNIEFIDPAQDQETENKVRSMGIPPVEMQILEKDEFKVKKGYLGIALLYQDEKEIIPIIENTQNLEYDLTSAIKRLIADELKKIAFLTGHEEHGISSSPFAAPEKTDSNDYTKIKKALDKNYKVTSLDITNGDPIDGVDTLIIAGPKKALAEKETYQIDQFIMEGGRVIFLLDKINVAPGLQAMEIETGLEELLKHYGINVKTDLVIDTKNENVAFSSGMMQFYLPYPFWPKLIRDNFLLEHPVMAKLQTISLPWVSSLNITEKENLDTKILATTTDNGSTVSAPFNLDPQQNFNQTNQKKIPIIAESQGEFTSFFAGKEIPLDEETKAGQETMPVSSLNIEDSQMITQSLEQSQIIVIGDSDFISDNYLKRFPNNGTFFLNAVDYLTLDSDLINIRSKTIQERPLKDISDGWKTFIKVLNIIIIPLIIIIIGLVKFYLRKKK